MKPHNTSSVSLFAGKKRNVKESHIIRGDSGTSPYYSKESLNYQSKRVNQTQEPSFVDSYQYEDSMLSKRARLTQSMAYDHSRQYRHSNPLTFRN